MITKRKPADLKTGGPHHPVQPIPVLPLLAALAVFVLPTLAAKRHHNPSTFACNSHYFVLMGHPKHPDVVSPNGKSEVHLTKDFAFRVLSHGKKITTLSYSDMSCCIEVGWSPDSRQFFIMYSDGGAMGGFNVRLFRIAGNRLIKSPAPSIVAREFESHHYSTMPGINIYLLNWTPDSRRVFLVAEAGSHGQPASG